MTLQEWVAALGEELGVPPDDVDIPLLLDVARDAAHSVARPAAPLTTFLVGYAAAARGGGSDTVRAVADHAVRLALAETADPPDLAADPPPEPPTGGAADRATDRAAGRDDERTD
jgi:hypothetical protein